MLLTSQVALNLHGITISKNTCYLHCYVITVKVEDGESYSLLHVHIRYLCIIFSWDKSFALQVQSTQVPWATLQCGSFKYATFSWKKLQSFPHLSPDHTFYRETIRSMSKFRCNDILLWIWNLACNFQLACCFHHFYQQHKKNFGTECWTQSWILHWHKSLPECCQYVVRNYTVMIAGLDYHVLCRDKLKDKFTFKKLSAHLFAGKTMFFSF